MALKKNEDLISRLLNSSLINYAKLFLSANKMALFLALKVTAVNETIFYLILQLICRLLIFQNNVEKDLAKKKICAQWRIFSSFFKIFHM
jgi:hypothetical protein